MMRPHDPAPDHPQERHRLIQRAMRYLALADEARDPLLVTAYREEADACFRLAQAGRASPVSRGT